MHNIRYYIEVNNTINNIFMPPPKLNLSNYFPGIKYKIKRVILTLGRGSSQAPVPKTIRYDPSKINKQTNKTEVACTY